MVNWNQDEYIRALIFAGTSHGNQKIPGSELPYLTHITLVAMEIMAAMTEETGFNGTYAVQCALLHDVIEDTEVSYEQLHDEFGKAVADGVLALTKNKTSDKYSAMKDSIERIKKQSR